MIDYFSHSTKVGATIRYFSKGILTIIIHENNGTREHITGLDTFEPNCSPKSENAKRRADWFSSTTNGVRI